MINWHFISNAPLEYSFQYQKIEVASFNKRQRLSKSTCLNNIPFDIINWTRVFFKNCDIVIYTLIVSVGILWSKSV